MYTGADGQCVRMASACAVLIRKVYVRC